VDTPSCTFVLCDLVDGDVVHIPRGAHSDASWASTGPSIHGLFNGTMSADELSPPATPREWVTPTASVLEMSLRMAADRLVAGMARVEGIWADHSDDAMADSRDRREDVDIYNDDEEDAFTRSRSSDHLIWEEEAAADAAAAAAAAVAAAPAEDTRNRQHDIEVYTAAKSAAAFAAGFGTLSCRIWA
jgi:hypothetical protein